MLCKRHPRFCFTKHRLIKPSAQPADNPFHHLAHLSEAYPFFMVTLPHHKPASPMTFTLKKGQTLADIFPSSKWKALFPASQSPGIRKQLNAEQYVGILKIHGTPLHLQKQLRDEWD